ncbi:MAG: 3-hydroxyacyl-CoA dehydrogenase NAD-binding domain-containing protein [Pirellulales bacterium]
MTVSPANTPLGILGVGQMGLSAAACFSRAGFPVLVWARSAAKLGELPAKLDALHAFLDQHVGPASDARGLVETTGDLGRLGETALVLECIAEDVGQKAELLAQLRPAAERGTVLASCTSGLCISEIGRAGGVGRWLVGAHFWNPAHLMPLVEVVQGDETDPAAVDFVCQVLERAGKAAVRCRDVPGFIGNRLMHALWREALHLVQTGVCSPADVDQVVRLTFALRLPAVGPFENMDLVGLGLVDQIHSYLFADLSNAGQSLPIVREKVAAGEAGMRAGRGFYDWGARDAQQLVAQRDEQIVRQLGFLRGIGRV